MTDKNIKISFQADGATMFQPSRKRMKSEETSNTPIEPKSCCCTTRQEVMDIRYHLSLITNQLQILLQNTAFERRVQYERHQEYWNRIVELSENQTDTYAMVDEFADAFRDHIESA